MVPSLETGRPKPIVSPSSTPFRYHCLLIVVCPPARPPACVDRPPLLVVPSAAASTPRIVSSAPLLPLCRLRPDHLAVVRPLAVIRCPLVSYRPPPPLIVILTCPGIISFRSPSWLLVEGDIIICRYIWTTDRNLDKNIAPK